MICYCAVSVCSFYQGGGNWVMRTAVEEVGREEELRQEAFLANEL